MSFDNNGFEFGEFFLDTEERALIKNGEKIPLTPKAYELLLELIKNSGHIISKESLMDSVWAGTIVEEGNLPFTIRLLRRALSDDAKQPRFIEGLPRRGYRFVAEVNEAPDRQNPGQVNGSQTEKKNFVVENGHIVAGARKPGVEPRHAEQAGHHDLGRPDPSDELDARHRTGDPRRRGPRDRVGPAKAGRHVRRSG